jgi:ATP-dependent DNA helicase RecG
MTISKRVVTPQALDLSQLPCQHLKGVGAALAERLSRLGIVKVQDVLFHLPNRYQDRTRVYPLGDVYPGEYVTIVGVVEQVLQPKGGKTRLFLRLKDSSGKLYLRFFYINAQQRQGLRVGARVRCFGEIRQGSHGLEMVHPEYHLVLPGNVIPVEENMTPIYPTTDGLSQATLRKLTQQALHLLAQGGVLPEILPATVLPATRFPALASALAFVHRPPTDAPLELLLEKKHAAQQRLVFEELLAHRLSLLALKNSFQTQTAKALAFHSEINTAFLAALPFALTAAQAKVSAEILADISKPHPMLRLVQGDVGSGKTVVAALAVLQAIANGYQAAILAPTEILAEQHLQTFRRWFEPLKIQVALLAKKIKPSLRRETLAGIEQGEIGIVIGTHAIFQAKVNFAKLALIIVDEQHRFGVEQRAMLREKGIYGEYCPHQLIMTATPIPRTLAMSVYADLDYSVIDELPPGRTPIMTSVLTAKRRDEILVRIREACAAGRQAYWVCTLIDESEELECEAAANLAAKLQEVLSELRIGLLHGRMKSADKEQIMADFKNGAIHLLVATTVIEVGVDVPNASLMVIENAERLGLAQLHQLRGRVGRGAVASYCLLLYGPRLSDLGKKRLAVLRDTTDGFKIAEKDLELRGPGEVLGTRQTGDVMLKIADLVRDAHLLTSVQTAATKLQQHHPELIKLLINRWIGQGEQYGQV